MRPVLMIIMTLFFSSLALDIALPFSILGALAVLEWLSVRVRRELGAGIAA